MVQQACEVAASLSAQDNEAAASGGGVKACGMRLHRAAHSHVRGKRFLNGRKPALPLCYTTGNTGQNRRLRKMNGVHTLFIFRKSNRKRVDGMHQRQKRRAPSLLRKVPLAQLSETPIPGHPGNARPEQRYRRRRHSAHGGFQPLSNTGPQRRYQPLPLRHRERCR